MMASNYNLYSPANLEEVPLDNNHLWAVVHIFEGYSEIDGLPEKIPIHRNYESNEIILVSKAKKTK